MTSRESVLSDFIDAWNAGERPRVLEYIRRVPSGPERDALAEELTTWLEVAPTPSLTPDARAAIRREPAVRHVLEAGDAGLWPALLPQLRARSGLGVRDLAAKLVAAFSLGEGTEERTADYLERMERGELAPERVSRRLLDRLGELLGTTGTLLREAAAGGPRPAPAGGLFLRAPGAGDTAWVEQQVQAISEAAMMPAPEPAGEGRTSDELDRLFTGGPDA